MANSGTTASRPLPQSKSGVADFDHFIGWPKPAYTRFRLGRGRGWGSGDVAPQCPTARPPHPDPPPQGGRELPSFAPCGQQILGGEYDDEFSVDLAFLDACGAGGSDPVLRPGPTVENRHQIPCPCTIPLLHPPPPPCGAYHLH